MKLGAVQKNLTHIIVSEKALLPHSPKYSRASRCEIEQYGDLQKGIPPQISLSKIFDIFCCCTKPICLKTNKNSKLSQGACDKPEFMQ